MIKIVGKYPKISWIQGVYEIRIDKIHKKEADTKENVKAEIVSLYYGLSH